MKLKMHITDYEKESFYTIIEDIASMLGCTLTHRMIEDALRKGMEKLGTAKGLSVPGGTVMAAFDGHDDIDLDVNIAEDEIVAANEFYGSLLGEFKPYVALIKAGIEMAKSSGTHLATVAEKFLKRYERDHTFGIVTVNCWNDVGMIAIGIVEHNGYYPSVKTFNVIGKRYDKLLDDKFYDAIRAGTVDWIVDEDGEKIVNCSGKAHALFLETTGKLAEAYTKNFIVTADDGDGNVCTARYSLGPDDILATRQDIIWIASKDPQPVLLPTVLDINKYLGLDKVGRDNIVYLKAVLGPIKESDWTKHVSNLKKSVNKANKGGQADEA